MVLVSQRLITSNPDVRYDKSLWNIAFRISVNLLMKTVSFDKSVLVILSKKKTPHYIK